MKTTGRFALITAVLTVRLAAADTSATIPDQAPIAEPPPGSTSAPTRTPEEQKKLEDAIRLRLAEHALKKAGKPASATAPDSGTTPSSAAATPTNPATVTAQATAASENPTMLLPRVEVSKSRITELAIALHEKDVEIAREKKNIKPRALDDTLNDPDVAHKLSLLGGSASSDRSRLAEERVSLLEAERDLIEQVYTARTDAERAELQKQLNELKTMRRELERAPKDERK